VNHGSESRKALPEHIQAIAKILYEDTPRRIKKALAGIQAAVQPDAASCDATSRVFYHLKTLGEHCDDNSASSELAFANKPTSAAAGGAVAHAIKSVSWDLLCFGKVLMSRMSMRRRTFIFHGVQVPRSVQQRLVHRQEFPSAAVDLKSKLKVQTGKHSPAHPLKGRTCTWQGSYSCVVCMEWPFAAEDNHRTG